MDIIFGRKNNHRKESGNSEQNKESTGSNNES